MTKSPIFTLLVAIFIAASTPVSIYGQEYQKAWQALATNDSKTAKTLLEKAQKDPKTAADAYLTAILMEIYDGNEDDLGSLVQKADKSLANPYPYYFAQWSTAAFAGDYGLKTDDQAKFLEKLIDDPKCPEMLKASARYQMSHHFLAKDEFKKAEAINLPISNVTEWQFTGPFDNVSGSGFDKNYPPIEKPGPDERFKSTNNAEVQWFTPKYNNVDGWVLVGLHVKWSTGIVYAQSFVNAPSDMDVVLASGFTGSSIKIWVNDQLLIAENEERKTDFDAFQAPARLKKGNNRILVQLGLEDGEFANFSCRLFGKDGALAQGLTSSAKYAAYPKATGATPPPITFFAEEYFQKKIAESPDNMLNYYLLGETYLRSKKAQQALESTDKALALQPDNIIFRFQRLQCYQKLGNRTALTQEIEEIKRLSPNHLLSLVFRYEEAIDNEKFDDAQALLEQWEKLYGGDKSIYEYRIKMLLQREKFQEALQQISEAYKAYPNEAYFANLQHDVELKVKKDPSSAVSVYNNYLRRNYYFPVAFALASDYTEMGSGNKAVDIYEKIDGSSPEDNTAAERLLNYYYNIKDTKKANVWVNKLLGNAPYHGGYWEDAAKIAERADNKTEALRNFKQALVYDPNDYDVRRQIRELEGKPDFATLLPQSDPVELYKKTKTAGKEGEHDWYYIQNERSAILYPERNSEFYSTILVKVLNEAGIDHWKESSIGYDEYRQRLIIEKAEVIKPNGNKIAAEQNGNELVFPNLQVGDGVHVKYRLVNYAFGRMAREFWASWYFNSFVPYDLTRYSLFVPTNIPVTFKNVNMDFQPTIKELKEENMKQYTWERTDVPAIKDQRMMPVLGDIGQVLQISTIPDWNEISTWYGDLSATQAKRDYDVLKLSKELFPAGKTMSQTEKAKVIYTWIVNNIRYSSVPFRQSGYVPQRASRVIQTRLGDCKDLATLYAALAREAGLKANLMLVNTRGEGANSMALPSMEFNHCIVKVVADGQEWYLELTDPELPFGSLPNSDVKAFVLEIPFGENSNAEAKPFFLEPKNRTKDYREEISKLTIKGRDFTVESEAIRGGSLTSNTRNNYKDLPPTKRVEDMQNAIAKKFTNTVSVKDLRFGDLETLQDTLHFNVKYTVKNEVMEIGEINTFKVPFFDVFFNADAFPEEVREHPVNYWEYEDSDQYKETVTVQLPAGKAFSDIPKDVTLSFDGMQYSLTYKKLAPDSLKVVREITTKRENIAAKDYDRFRAFTEEVINAETRWVAFK